jgi:hypothetical protein
MNLVRHLALLTALLSLTGSAFALVVTGYTPAKHDFDRSGARNASFIGSNFDWSGVAITSSNHWVTVIDNPFGPNKFGISARHFRPPVGATATFYYHNSAGTQLGSETVTVAARHDIFNDPLAFETFGNSDVTDLALIEFDTAVSGNIKAYEIYIGDTRRLGTGPDDTAPFGDIDGDVADPASGEVDNILFVVGKGGGSTIQVGTTTSRIEGTAGNTGAPGQTSQIIFYPTDPSNADPFAPNVPSLDQAYGVAGDSGAPSFYAPYANATDGSGFYEMTVVGVNSESDSNGIIQTVADLYIPQINTVMAAAIPGPRFFGLLFASCVAFTRRRTRFRNRS